MLGKDLIPDYAEVWFCWGAVCELALNSSFSSMGGHYVGHVQTGNTAFLP